MGTGLIGYEHHRPVTMQHLCFLFKMLHKDGKAGFGHLWQQQGNQIACGWGQGNVQVSELVAQLYFAQRPMALWNPPALALGAGTRPQFITIVGAAALPLL